MCRDRRLLAQELVGQVLPATPSSSLLDMLARPPYFNLAQLMLDGVGSSASPPASPEPQNPQFQVNQAEPQSLLQEPMGQMQPAMPTQLNWYRGNSIVRGASQRTAVQRVRALPAALWDSNYGSVLQRVRALLAASEASDAWVQGLRPK